MAARRPVVATDAEGVAEDDVDAGGDEVAADGDGLFAHPFRSQAHRWNLVNIVTQAAVLNHLSEYGQNSSVIHA